MAKPNGRYQRNPARTLALLRFVVVLQDSLACALALFRTRGVAHRTGLTGRHIGWVESVFDGQKSVVVWPLPRKGTRARIPLRLEARSYDTGPIGPAGTNAIGRANGDRRQLAKLA